MKIHFEKNKIEPNHFFLIVYRFNILQKDITFQLLNEFYRLKTYYEKTGYS